MNMTTASNTTLDTGTPVTEWLQLTTDPLSDDGAVICAPDARTATLALIQMDPVRGPIEVISSGTRINAQPTIDRDDAKDRLKDRFGDRLTPELLTEALNWYENFIQRTVADDIYDQTCETTFVNGRAYIPESDTEDFISIIEWNIEDCDMDLARDLADEFLNFWTPDDDETALETNDHAAIVELTD